MPCDWAKSTMAAVSQAIPSAVGTETDSDAGWSPEVSFRDARVAVSS